MQEGPVGVRHHPPLGLADEVSLLFVWDGPALLDLTKLLQPVIKALRGGGGGEREVKSVCSSHPCYQRHCGMKIFDDVVPASF